MSIYVAASPKSRTTGARVVVVAGVRCSVKGTSVRLDTESVCVGIMPRSDDCFE